MPRRLPSRPRGLVIAALAALLLGACRPAPVHACTPLEYDGAPYTVCAFDVADTDLRLFLTHPDGSPYGQFDRLAAQLSSEGKTLAFAMNAGMYHDDRRAVGLYVENGEQAAPLIRSAGPGNFGMLPNGVFWLDAGKAGVTETHVYETRFATAPPRYATQSGPMLVINGALHPDFNEDGPSRKRRNGVGVSADGTRVYFAISELPVNFHSFASLFRDELHTPDALYLDGVVSKLYAPDLSRNEGGLDMGPIVGAVIPDPATP
ncbi:phosphodiester glycosidase family protein [Hyphomonas johnsonii]|uniref:Putative lipoprotein n=1 Tax=Hyphomonas johnsonii MHS-2 TaxID=1280950 RepID=A0A059FPC8_9PROT|nr:phosphodiester glycosidase family protein [Hyphomonas johnsonii]KCZ92328.1 putative lipoprotein [Hyphomonas johnsonii MHS-2]